MGARLGFWLFWGFGLTAYMVPALLMMFGLGYLVGFLSYLQQRWIWGAVLLFCCMGLLSMFEKDLGYQTWVYQRLEITSSGGLAGQFFYRHALRYIGKVGGSIVLAGLYIISLLYLTNFRLGAMVP